MPVRVKKKRTSKRKRSANNQIRREYNYRLAKRERDIERFERLDEASPFDGLWFCFLNIKDLKRDTRAKRVGRGARSFATTRELKYNHIAAIAVDMLIL